MTRRPQISKRSGRAGRPAGATFRCSWCFKVVPRDHALMVGAAMSGPFDRKDLRGETFALEVDGQSLEAFMPWPGQSFAVVADRIVLFACRAECRRALVDLARGTPGGQSDRHPLERKLAELLLVSPRRRRDRQTVH